ncbi:hypothetical protein [Rhizobium sp. Leaf262]|uniref:hypothetical protein n=1 Tax=Rhizobium sp. Leaf262 TaxID=1736312 RepID=UPI000715590B|nr:hypothetical protein [Rhizobium sp. Leaf262]KQO79437.1 hypothetical protein ASF29_23285 [Rhizobium sp. Leaf262]
MEVKKVKITEGYDEAIRVLPWLTEALQYSSDSITETDIIRGLIEYDYQLWLTDHAACITSFTEWEGKTVCCLFLISGEKGKALPEILAAHPILEEYAREKGCDGLLGIGRATWLKALSRIGFEQVSKRGSDNVYFKEV